MVDSYSEDIFAYKVYRLIILSVNIIDASIMVDKTVRTVYGLSYSDRKSLDPYYGNLAFYGSVFLLCIFACILLHQFCYGSFNCILEIIWTLCWVVWFTFGIIAATFDCLGIQPVCKAASLLAGLSFLNWLLLLLLNITISMHVNTQLKAGNRRVWFQMPFPYIFVTQTRTTSVPLQLQAPAVLQPPAIIRPIHPPSTNVNPATVVDGRDEMSMRRTSTMVDHRLGDGRDNV